VERRAAKLKIDHLYQGASDKVAAAREIIEKEGVSWEEVAYIGDDVNCLELLKKVGLPACPANALPKIKAIPGILRLEKSGGEGAVREFIEWIMERGLHAQ
jgi:YrbI family 3-deoxy-D-manno-octulosonate 8-phosphate phosphatase